MQSFVERQLPPLRNASGMSRRRQIVIAAAIGFVVAAVFVFDVLGALPPATVGETTAIVLDATQPQIPPTSLRTALSTIYAPPQRRVAIPPWGYSSTRNAPRLSAIEASINNDWTDPTTAAFTLVDYGSDQGYFAVNLAHLFRSSRVISVEMGGVGGEIWKKKAEPGADVLSIQEKMCGKYDVTNLRICQTKIVPEMFDQLNTAHVKHRYQLVLSVFHWFDLPTRAAFEHAICNLFRNAGSTFIELPTIGDRSALIRKQVGWQNFERWYDGRDDIGQILVDAANSANIRVHVTKLVSVPWLKWARDLYRVDVDAFTAPSFESKTECMARRTTYQCATRARLEICP